MGWSGRRKVSPLASRVPLTLRKSISGSRRRIHLVMSSIVNISFASEADIRTMAQIGIAAYRSDLVARILFHGPENDKRVEDDLAASRLKALLNPKHYIYKATMK